MEEGKPPAVGGNIQHIRKQRKMTLDVLAEKSGVSKAMLSQIESDKVNPTLATIWKIARGLDVELDVLLKGNKPTRKFAVTRSHDITVLDTAEHGPHIQVLSPITLAEDLEMYLLSFDPHTTLNSGAHAPKSEEFLTVIEGGITVEVGEQSAQLGPGDFIVYNCDVNHIMSNPHDDPAKVHMVVRFEKQHW
jgi:transcriptional regulator with XRE-family HTH domain